MDTLIQWSLRNRLIVLVVSAVLLFAGAFTAQRMPVDVFPDLTAPTVTVITEAPGMAPAEVETQVTFPIETALNGAAGVRRVRSATAVGLSVVWTEFEWGTDIRGARQIVSEKVALVANDLPLEVERPILAPVSSIMGEILFLSLTSESHSPLELRSYAETQLRRRLLAVPGVSQVTPIGGGEQQYQVILSQDHLLKHNLGLNEVLRALEEGNENVSAGVLNEHGSEWLVTGVGRVRSLDDLKATVIKATQGVPLTIGQVGTVRIGEAPKRGEASANAQRAVLLGIQKQPGANTLELTRRLDIVLDTVEKIAPGRDEAGPARFSTGGLHSSGDQQCSTCLVGWHPFRGSRGRHFPRQPPRGCNQRGGNSSFPRCRGPRLKGLWRHHQHHDAGWNGNCHWGSRGRCGH